MIVIEKLKEKDADLLEQWKRTCEFENDIVISTINKADREVWIDRINLSNDCKYWIINNCGIKIGVIDINHMDKEGCTLEYYIGDIHFRNRSLTETILWNMYNYIFNELNMQYVVTNIHENDKKNLNIHLNMGCEISGRFKESKYKNEKAGDLLYLLIKKEKWNNIKGEFNYDEIAIEKI